jgi:DNA-binding transcriptional MerR regulator
MYIHKDKLEAALKLMEEGRSTRDVARQTGLSFKQLKYVRRLSGMYVDVKEYGRRLERLREERRAELERLEHLDELVRLRSREVEELEAKADEILESVREEVRAFLSFTEGLTAALSRIEACLEGLVGALCTFAAEPQGATFGWVSRERWEEAFRLSREWRGRLDEAIAFLKEQRGRLELKAALKAIKVPERLPKG